MTITLKAPDIRELKPRITVFGCGGAGGNAVNNMIESGLMGVEFVVANTDAQALLMSKADRIIQMGLEVTQGLGAGSQPEVGRAAAEEVMDEIRDHLAGAHMVFVTAGMGGGTGTGAAPVVARTARDMGILTVGVVTKPFHFEGQRRMKIADAGIHELQANVDTLIVIPNQNLFRLANEKTTFADAFSMADQVLYSGVACITDLMVKEGLINLDFADVRSVMREMGKAMMGTGEASGDKRALSAAEAAISNPLLDEVSMKGARGLLISITGGKDMTLYEVDEAATRIREEVDSEANIIVGATFDEGLEGVVRVSVVATGIDQALVGRSEVPSHDARIAEAAQRLRDEARLRASEAPTPFVRATPEASPAVRLAATAPQPAPQPAFEPLHDAGRGYAPEPMPAADTIFDFAAPAHTPQPVEMAHAHHAEAFIPPAAERPPVRAPRMPRVDELPRPAQEQIRVNRGEAPSHATHPTETKRMTLLQRLAAVGLGRKDDVPAGPAPVETRAPAPVGAPVRPAPISAAHAEYARRPIPVAAARPAQGAFEQPARPAGTLMNFEDDQLAIPAFLRRQAQ